ncbi:MAG: transglutaminase domain-containing protein, partial [Gammaproteobacteria bacterium]
MEARRLLEKLLYYQPPAPEKDYSDAPKTGGFDLQRLVNRMPCWDDVSLQGDSRKLKHKKLVITDWSLRYFSENDSDKPKEKQKLYEFLLAEGAELYAWTGALTKITTLADLQTALRKIEPVDEEVVAAELAKADIAKSAYEIINLEKTQKLLLKLAPVLPFQPEHGINIELSFLNQLEPDVVLAILASLKSQKIYVVLSNSAIDKSLFSRIIPHISTMALSPAGVEFLKKFFDETTEMIFQRPVEVGVHNSSRERSNLINELIHSPYYARFISFTEFVRIHDDELSISIRNLNTLHTYTFMALENETINLTKILSGAAFKKFTLRTKESNIILPLTEATNIRLTSLALSGPAFKAAQYCQLLSATAATLETLELREINLTNSKDKTENFSTHLVPLEKLSTLIVTKESKLTEFNQFLERCPNLSVLRIQADSLVTFSSFKKETVFNKLTVLEIDQEISAEDLLELVKRSPNLTRLKVKKIYGKLPVDPGFINQQLTRFEVADADEDCLDTYSSFCRIFPNVTYLAIPFYGSAKKLNCRWHNLAQLTYEIMPDKNTCTDMLHLVELCPDAITINSDSSAQYTTIKKINTSKVKVLNVTRLVLNEASCDDQMRNLLGLCPNLKKIIVTDDMEEEKVIDFLLTCPPLKLLQGLQINPHIACTGEQLNNLWKRYPSLEAISIKLNDDEIRLLCMSTSLDINVLLRLESYSFSEYSEFNVEDNIEATLLEKMLAHLTNPDSAIVNFNVYTLGGFLKKKYLSKNSPNQTPGLAIDTNTESSTRPLVAKQIFTYKKNNSPHPASYRLDVRKVNASAQADKITEQKEYSSKKNLTALYEEKYADTADIYLGKIFIPDDHNGWFALPSLTTRDQILDLSADAPVMLGYCEEKALYYVKPLTARKPKHVSFIVKASNAEFVAVKMPEIAFERLRFNAEGKLEPSPVLEELNKLSEIEKISALSQFLHTFSSGKLPVTANTRFEKINALLEFRKGACRHVSWIFEAFAAAWGIEARIINNGLHMFVEVKCADGWKTLDLGGAESNIKIIPQQQGLTKADLHTPPDEKKEESKSVPLPPVTLSPNNPFTTWNTVKSSAKDYDSYCKELIEKALKLPPGKRNVLVTLNAEELPSFHAHLTRYVQQNKNDSCYLHHLADISTKEPQIKDGHLETTESKLISLARDAKPGDVLVANWSGYRAADIGYNTMQDTVRKLKSTPISKEAVIISVVTKDEIKRLGEDFYSRYRLISELPELVNDQPLKLQLEAKEASSLTVAEFYADDWQTVLLGQITVNGKTFIQKPGLLAQAITEKPPGLMLQNAPWHSEKFNLFISELLIKKSFRLNGETIKLPDGFVIQSRDVPYQLTSKMMCFTPSVVEQEQPLVLNSFTYAHFFQQLECKDNLIYHRTGWL